ncbi:MAG: CrcB family protein [Actinomycetota bacterium]|nr:CrcB family protein [Actinomycetota bacterium]
MIPLMIAIGAAIGAPARFLADRAIQSRHETIFPWGTLTVNLFASLVFGTLAGLSGHLSATVVALVGTGLCGALSTFSTFSYETMRLIEERSEFYAAANVGLSVLACLGAAALGWSIGLSFS